MNVEHPDTEPGYRDNVGVTIVNSQAKVLAGEAFYYPGEWLMPQGGIDPDESPLEAMRRELREETGLDAVDAEILCELTDWIYYLFKQPQYKDDIFYKGQRQKWFLLYFDGPVPGPDIAQVQEFSQFGWVEPSWLVRNTAPFLQSVYRQVLGQFGAHFPR